MLEGCSIQKKELIEMRSFVVHAPVVMHKAARRCQSAGCGFVPRIPHKKPFEIRAIKLAQFEGKPHSYCLLVRLMKPEDC